LSRNNAGRIAKVLALIVVGALLAVPAGAKRTLAQKKQAAHTLFDTAERMREALNGRAAAERTRRDDNLVIDAYRSVYFTAPTSNRADASVAAVAELMAEMGKFVGEAMQSGVLVTTQSRHALKHCHGYQPPSKPRK
jgi:glutamate-1-semialdehyde aminotransferase